MRWFKPAILATQEAEILRIVVSGQFEQTLMKPPSQPMAGRGSVLLLSTATKETTDGGHDPGQSGHKTRSSHKNNHIKRASRLAQWKSTCLVSTKP
jgi:hypothetical protein